MTIRQKLILGAVIKEYVDTAEPVGSGILVKKYEFNLSSATVRNEMKKLEKEGYLYQPHISAGRIPTDKGYRFFIDSLIKKENLPTKKEQDIIKREFEEFEKETNRFLQQSARFFAEMSNGMAISGFWDFDEPRFHKSGFGRLLKEPEFSDFELLSQATEMFDYLDENIEKLFEIIPENSIEVYIGRENPIKEIQGVSMIISGYHSPKVKKKGLIALLGPIRMRYERNISLTNYIRKLLSDF